MPKGILSFKLPKEREEFEAAHRGDLFRYNLQDLDSWLRGKTKHEDKIEIKIDEVRTKIYEICEERGVPLWE